LKTTLLIIRLIRKWLKAGVLEDGVVTTSERGRGRESVISPLLANIYLHYVFDLWAARWRRREATGDMVIVRYADTTFWTPISPGSSTP
jgi:RNA-directed DNA polymerase